MEAAFSIMRAFRQAGMPQYPNLPAIGSFKDWSRKVRDLVYWLTDCDVSEGLHLNKAEDHIGRTMLLYWKRSMTTTSTKVKRRAARSSKAPM